MTVSKQYPAWPCVIGALALLAAPTAEGARPAAAERHAATLFVAPAENARPAVAEPRSDAASTLFAVPAENARPAAAAPRADRALTRLAASSPAGARPAAAAQRADRARPAARAPRRTGHRSRQVLRTRAWFGPGYGVYAPFHHPAHFYGPWGPAPWGAWGAWGPWGPYPLHTGYYYREGGTVRLQVKPVETEVYVDGYYAGVVDSYDGLFQRLSLPPGRHDIELRLEGYRSVQEQVYLAVGQSFRIRHMMEPLGPGETTPPPPEPAEVEPDPARRPEPFARPETDRATAPPAASPAAGFGRLLVRVQPTDAAIFVDGEEWRTPDGSRLELELGAGRHRIEVRRAGREAYVTDVTVRDGETTAVNISLPRNQPPPEEPASPPGA